MTARHVALVAFLICFLAASASAQTLSVSGRVSDSQGGAVNAAVVTLTIPGAPSPRTTRTDADGTFSIAGLPSGSYVLQIEAPGFQRWAQSVSDDKVIYVSLLRCGGSLRVYSEPLIRHNGARAVLRDCHEPSSQASDPCASISRHCAEPARGHLVRHGNRDDVRGWHARGDRADAPGPPPEPGPLTRPAESRGSCNGGCVEHGLVRRRQ